MLFQTRKIKRKHGLILLLLLLFAACCRSDFSTGKMIFRYNESSGIATLDPAYASGQSTIWACNQLYQGLLDFDDSLHLIPCIAKEWLVSEDGKIYTFFLRTDVLFHQTDYFSFEKPRYVRAEDFVYSFNRILETATASPGAWVFNHVARDSTGHAAFVALNDSVLQITLSNPFPPFAGILAMKYCSVLPKEAIDFFGKDFRTHPIGTGPFLLKSWSEGVKMVLHKNEHYFEKDTQGTPLPYLDAVAITFISEKQSVFMEFMKGSIDFMSGVEAAYKDALLTQEGTLRPEHAKQIQMLTAPYLNTEYLGFNLSPENKNNPLLIKEIRQAINYSFDRRKMLRYLRGNIGMPGIHGFVPPGIPCYDASRLKGYDYNPEKAELLLQKAGFPHGKGLPPIHLSVSASYLDLCQYIQHELAQTGFDIRLDLQQAAQQRQMMREYRLPFFRASWIADYPDAENYLSLFYSRNLQPRGSNYTHYVNSTYDQYFEQAMTTLNDTLRGQNYARMDSIVMAEAPVVVLYYDQVTRFTRKTVKNLGINPVNMLQLKKVKIKEENGEP
ncbi:MAG: ABC transporter substrate-binding protein [Bacteroidales bacterium]|jgi:peptide/nickel transport system substrate-binding protein|nr:ABC transporter substrate-binding protein [Bacteroidales bacterium]